MIKNGSDLCRSNIQLFYVGTRILFHFEEDGLQFVPFNVIGRMLRFRAMIKRYRCFAIATADCIVDFVNITHASFQIFNLHLLFLTLKPGLIGVGYGGVLLLV